MCSTIRAEFPDFRLLQVVQNLPLLLMTSEQDVSVDQSISHVSVKEQVLLWWLQKHSSQRGCGATIDELVF